MKGCCSLSFLAKTGPAIVRKDGLYQELVQTVISMTSKLAVIAARGRL